MCTINDNLFFRQHNDALKKCDQTMKDAEYYHGEAESLRSRCVKLFQSIHYYIKLKKKFGVQFF